eukprot:Hpha_TRINITY_DN16085_c0_g1::TRINITY_DN16085_c0_g1_i1::g.118862::m.118862
MRRGHNGPKPKENPRKAGRNENGEPHHRMGGCMRLLPGTRFNHARREFRMEATPARLGQVSLALGRRPLDAGLVFVVALLDGLLESVHWLVTQHTSRLADVESVAQARGGEHRRRQQPGFTQVDLVPGEVADRLNDVRKHLDHFDRQVQHLQFRFMVLKSGVHVLCVDRLLLTDAKRLAGHSIPSLTQTRFGEEVPVDNVLDVHVVKASPRVEEVRSFVPECGLEHELVTGTEHTRARPDTHRPHPPLVVSTKNQLLGSRLGPCVVVVCLLPPHVGVPFVHSVPDPRRMEGHVGSRRAHDALHTRFFADLQQGLSPPNVNPSRKVRLVRKSLPETNDGERTVHRVDSTACVLKVCLLRNITAEIGHPGLVCVGVWDDVEGTDVSLTPRKQRLDKLPAHKPDANNQVLIACLGGALGRLEPGHRLIATHGLLEDVLLGCLRTRLQQPVQDKCDHSPDDIQTIITQHLAPTFFKKKKQRQSYLFR